MPEASTYRRGIAAAGVFVLTAGDFLRYGLTWYGWGAIVLVLLALAVIELVRERIDPRRLPVPLLLFVLFAALTSLWSPYASSVALGVASTLVVTTFALFLGALLSWREVVGAFSLASRFMIGLSLLFEAIVSLVIRKPILPLWVAYCDPHDIRPACYWSRDVLLHGGRIQGIVGNANLLAMAALVGLIVFAVRWAARDGSRIWNGVWIVLALATIGLTRSSTVILATAAVVVVAVFLLLVRRVGEARVIRTHLIGLGVLVLGCLAAIAGRTALLDLLGKSSDFTGRTEIWAKVAHLFVERPVGGWGWVGYWPNWEPFFQLVKIKGIHYYQAHDAWLDLLMQTGVIGAVLFALFVLVALGRAWRRALHAETPGGAVTAEAPATWPLVAAAPLLVVAVLVQSLAESRLLIEIGLAIPVIVAVAMHRRRTAVGG